MAKRSGLSVLDLVIMVAATAPGLAVVRALPQFIAIEHSIMVYQTLVQSPTQSGGSGFAWHLSHSNRLTSTGDPFHRRPSYWLGHVPCWTAPCLVSWSVTAWLLGLLTKPRHRRGRFAGRPGMAVGVAVILAMGVEGLQVAWIMATSGGMPVNSQGEWRYGVPGLTSLVRLTGYTVAAFWLALALSGRWASERNSGGTIGRALGWCWIAMALSSEVGHWCFALNH